MLCVRFRFQTQNRNKFQDQCRYFSTHLGVPFQRQELQANPFMRCDQAEVIAMAKEVSGQESLATPAHVLAVIRAWKDRF